MEMHTVCQKCHSVIPLGSKFCPNCGVAMPVQVAQEQAPIILEVTSTEFTDFPPGLHEVTLDSISLEHTAEGRSYLRWVFKRNDGSKMLAFSSTKFNPRSKAWKWYIALARTQPPSSGKVTLNTLIGRRCKIYVTTVVDQATGQTRHKIVDVQPILEANDLAIKRGE